MAITANYVCVNLIFQRSFQFFDLCFFSVSSACFLLQKKHVLGDGTSVNDCGSDAADTHNAANDDEL